MSWHRRHSVIAIVIASGLKRLQACLRGRSFHVLTTDSRSSVPCQNREGVASRRLYPPGEELNNVSLHAIKLMRKANSRWSLSSALSFKLILIMSKRGQFAKNKSHRKLCNLSRLTVTTSPLDCDWPDLSDLGDLSDCCRKIRYAFIHLRYLYITEPQPFHSSLKRQ